MGEQLGRNESLVIEGLHKKFASQDREVIALQDINLTIKQGEFISIVGSSGCGKKAG